MAWPYTATHTTYIANMPVTSDSLNEVQERIVNVFESKTMIITQFVSAPDYTHWVVDSTTSRYHWVSLDGLGTLVAFIDLPIGSVLTAFSVKWFNNDVGNQKANAELFLRDLNIDADTTAPSLGSAITDLSGTADIATGAWGVRTVTGLTTEITAYHDLIISMAPNVTGDAVAGIQLTYLPVKSA